MLKFQAFTATLLCTHLSHPISLSRLWHSAEVTGTSNLLKSCFTKSFQFAIYSKYSLLKVGTECHIHFQAFFNTVFSWPYLQIEILANFFVLCKWVLWSSYASIFRFIFFPPFQKTCLSPSSTYQNSLICSSQGVCLARPYVSSIWLLTSLKALGSSLSLQVLKHKKFTWGRIPGLWLLTLMPLGLDLCSRSFVFDCCLLAD